MVNVVIFLIILLIITRKFLPLEVLLLQAQDRGKYYVETYFTMSLVLLLYSCCLQVVGNQPPYKQHIVIPHISPADVGGHKVLYVLHVLGQVCHFGGELQIGGDPQTLLTVNGTILEG